MLQLSADERSEIAQIQQELLQLAESRAQSDVRRCLGRLRNVLNARGAFAFYFFAGTPIFIEDNIGEELSDYVFGTWRGFDRNGDYVFEDKELEEINRLRRSFGSGVHHEQKIGARDIIMNTRFFREGFAPAGMHHVIGMTARLPVGEAIFAFGFEGDEDPGFAGDRSEALLELVLPVFEHAFGRLYAGSPSAEAVAVSLDTLSLPAALVAEDGEIVHANATFDPRLIDAAQKREAHVVRIPGPFLDGLRPSIVLMGLDAATRTPNIAEAAREAGLSARQAEVARLVAHGLTDRQIGETLGISINTARRHSEAVLDRLGVSARSAVLMTLLRLDTHDSSSPPEA